ncbi:MAG: hypothetical protein JSS11_17985 [Verrucomicrobia bacterium]|nr:hypothetical protein [Verrucomicrobiota bacterium]
MNDTNSAIKPRRRWWRWVLGILGVCLLMSAVAIVDLVTLNRDAAAMRRAVFSAVKAEKSTHVQLSVGPVLLGTVRKGLGFSHHVPEEAKLALKGVKAASVGVYALDREVGAEERGRVLAAVDPVMLRRGWERLVVASEAKDTVMIYTQPTDDAHDPLRVCLAVCEGREIVIVSATAEPDALVELAARHGGRLARR